MRILVICVDKTTNVALPHWYHKANGDHDKHLQLYYNIFMNIIIIIIIIYQANLNEKIFLELFNLFDNFEMHIIIYIL